MKPQVKGEAGPAGAASLQVVLSLAGPALPAGITRPDAWRGHQPERLTAGGGACPALTTACPGEQQAEWQIRSESVRAGPIMFAVFSATLDIRFQQIRRRALESIMPNDSAIALVR